MKVGCAKLLNLKPDCRNVVGVFYAWNLLMRINNVDKISALTHTIGVFNESRS